MTQSLRLTRCPVCRARLTGAEPLAQPCRRCDADLSLVRATERRAEWACAQALAAAAAGQGDAARVWARRAVSWVDHPVTRAAWAVARDIP